MKKEKLYTYEEIKAKSRQFMLEQARLLDKELTKSNIINNDKTIYV